MRLHFFDVERVAGVAHHSLFFISGFEFAFAVNSETHRRFLRGQPMRHGGLRRGLGVQQRHRQAGQGFDQRRHHFVGTPLAGGVEHQHARLQVQPHPHGALLGERHGQQVELGLVLEFLAFLLAGLPARFLLDAHGFFFHAARQHRARQHLGLNHEAQHPLPTHRFGQRAMRFTARRHPAP